MSDHGKIVWSELNSTDVGAAAPFYAAVVGWTASTVPMPGGEEGTYTVFGRAEGEMSAGGFTMAGPRFQGIPSHWLTYVEVDDVDAAVAKVEPAGGTVKTPGFDVPGVGRIAVVADPSGAVFALIKSVSRA